MEFNKVVKKRYSMRQFKPTKIPENIIREIIDLAKLAPSAGNLQSYKVVITKEKVTAIDAPLNLVICADLEKSAARYGERGRSLYALQDATIFGAYLQLAIVDAGLASVWVGVFSERAIRKKFGLNKNLKPIAVIPLGYSDVVKKRGRRKGLEKIIWQKT